MTTTLHATQYVCGHRKLTAITPPDVRTKLWGEDVEKPVADVGQKADYTQNLAMACPLCDGKTRDVVVHMTGSGCTLGRPGSTYEPRILVHGVPAHVPAAEVMRVLRAFTAHPYGYVETQIGWGWMRAAPAGSIRRTVGRRGDDDVDVRYC